MTPITSFCRSGETRCPKQPFGRLIVSETAASWQTAGTTWLKGLIIRQTVYFKWSYFLGRGGITFFSYWRLKKKTCCAQLWKAWVRTPFGHINYIFYSLHFLQDLQKSAKILAHFLGGLSSHRPVCLKNHQQLEVFCC